MPSGPSAKFLVENGKFEHNYFGNYCFFILRRGDVGALETWADLRHGRI